MPTIERYISFHNDNIYTQDLPIIIFVVVFFVIPKINSCDSDVVVVIVVGEDFSLSFSLVLLFG